MLLQRLVEFQRPRIDPDDELPPFFQLRPVRWIVRLDDNGELISPRLRDLSDPTAGPRGKLGTPGAVPYIARAAGISPLLGADDVQYVLGWPDEKSKPERVADCHAAFVDLIERWAAAAPNDHVAQAARKFFQSGAHARIERPAQWTSKQSVVLTVGAEADWITERPSLRRFWAEEVARRKAGGRGTGSAAQGEAAGRAGVCLVCGDSGVLVDRFPQQLPRRLVPLTSQANAALVSANRRIHTYDNSENLTTVPICLDCAQVSVANLHYLLDSERHAMSAGGDGRMAWWTTGTPFDFTAAVARPDPSQVSQLVAMVHRGTTSTNAVEEFDPDRFCSVTVAGNVSRVMIRDWVDMPLSQLRRNLGSWFLDHRLFGADPASYGYFPLVRLELATGRWEPKAGENGRGAYARFGAPGAGRPDGVQRQLLRAAISGGDLSPALFGHLLNRIRSDGHVDDPRAALLRLALVRRARRRPENERPTMPGPGLDPDNRHPAYLAGRVFAELEAIQFQASGIGKPKGERLNTTFADRYLPGAIANPRIALVQGQQLAPAWLKKIRKTNPVAAIALSARLGELFALFDASGGFPGRGSLDDQATFILGYHHHRSDSIGRARAAKAAGKAGEADEQGAAGAADAAGDVDAAGEADEAHGAPLTPGSQPTA
ncbi:CRISPR-associated protein, Csd1 family [Frankia sp. EI5c]|uniref:type I-C CRISPR-associated protein Cas8c/Csd1 n=1 Tax=Frankia sp. EI5c TaxID=683316 RepID=UPI0007C34D26|nr:type I-C CRISPR-associated protein Cas8c/Csd1 [Frankia sp. EI5c]OAA19957.1 CRISPR-associated protein, Csd1 family [Frankia sp. EI5c]